jgi:hypothetical protein
MNERIRLLSEQAHRSTADELAHLQRVHNRTYDLNESAAIYNEKFAELIVAECAMFVVTELEGKVGSRIADATANRLEEHFGVE